jgi:hypothetical protein
MVKQKASCNFKSTRKINHDILGLRDKPTILESCRFPLTNPHKGPIVDFVPMKTLVKIQRSRALGGAIYNNRNVSKLEKIGYPNFYLNSPP